MIYRELLLPEPLRRVALCAWQFIIGDADPAAFQHQVPPDGGTAFTLVEGPAGPLRTVLVGPMLSAFTVPVMKGLRYCGLRLRPEMAGSVTGLAPQPGMVQSVAATGRLAPMWEDLAALNARGTDWSGTIACLANHEAGDEAVSEAIDRLIATGGTTPLKQLASLAQLSERQFRRRFHAATGITPKQYADVQRARRALILALEDPDWAGIAHDSGFADQPHLIRDIKERFGAAPRRITGYFGGIRHELLDGGHVRNIQADAARAA